MPVNIWTILGIFTPILLIFYWKSKNAVWGGLTIGIFTGLVIAVIFYFKNSDFAWIFITKGAITGTMIGFLAELISKFGNLITKKRP